MKAVRHAREGKIDNNVILDYRSERINTFKKTLIGDNFRIRSNTVIYSNSIIGDNLETGHNVVIREENKIGDNFSIWSNSSVDYGCRIENNVKIHNNVYIAQFTIIEGDVFIAPGVMLANDKHPICKKCMKGPVIKKGARIGVNATLLPAVVIGKYSLIAAGSVITSNVPDYAVVCGSPASIIGSVNNLKCLKGLVTRPYIKGRDVYSRMISKK